MSPNPPASYSGQPPKTSVWIRAVLKHVHGANAGSASDLSPGTAGNDRMALVPAAEFRRARDAREFAALLTRWRIPCKILRRGRHRFVHVAAVHLDEALALAVAFRRNCRQRQLAHSPATSSGAMVPRSAASRRVLLLLLAVMFGAVLGRWALVSGGNGQPAGWGELVGVLGGALLGYFTWMSCASMIRDFRQYFPPVRTAPKVAPPIDEVEPRSTSSWSTLLTISRSRKQSRAESARSSATNRC